MVPIQCGGSLATTSPRVSWLRRVSAREYVLSNLTNYEECSRPPPQISMIARQPSPRKRDLQWLIYLACYSGCRLEELCQLARDDTRQVSGIWILDINDGDGRKIKNEYSRRLVPIHPVLINRGFLQYANDENGVSRRVFPSLRLVKTVQGAGTATLCHRRSAAFSTRSG